MKKAFALMLALALALFFAACGGVASSAPAATSAPDAGSASAPDDRIEISVIVPQYSQNTRDWWAGFEQAFNAEYTQINLQVEVVSGDDIYTVTDARILSGSPPDILDTDAFAEYQAAGLLLPAEEYVPAETYAGFYPAFLEQSVVGGVVWAVPNLVSARALYYNADILKNAGVNAPPASWEELEAACQKIRQYDPTVCPWGMDMTTDEGEAAFAYYTWNNGGGFLDSSGGWALNSDANVAAIEYALNLVNSGYTNSDPAADTRYDLQDLFSAGRLAMMIGPHNIPAYLEEGGSNINFGVAPIPANGGSSVTVGDMHRFVCFDNGYSDEELGAVQTFFDFFYADTRYSAWAQMEGFLPATRSGIETIAAADPGMAPWADIVGSCQFYPTARAEWGSVERGVIEVEQAALLGGSVKELLNDLQSQITAG